MNFTITNNGATSIRVDSREKGKVYDSHVANEDALQATFDSTTIPPGVSHIFENHDIIRVVELGA